MKKINICSDYKKLELLCNNQKNRIYLITITITIMDTLIYNNGDRSIGPNEDYINGLNEDCTVGPDYVITNRDHDDFYSHFFRCNDTNTCHCNSCIGVRNVFCYALCEYNIICHCDNCMQSSINGYCKPNCDCAICFHYRNCYDMATCNCREKSNAMYIATFCKDWTQEEVAEHHSDSRNTEDTGDTGDTGEDANYDSDSDCETHDRVYPATAAPTRVVFDCGNCGTCFDCTSTFPCGCIDVCLCDGYNEDTNYDSD